MKVTVRCVTLTLVVLVATGRLASQGITQRRAAEGSFDRSLSAAGIADVEVSTGSEPIAVRQGSTESIQIRGRIQVGTERRRSDREAEDLARDIESNPPIEQLGNSIRIGRSQDRDSYRNVSISYEIVMPANVSLRASTGSGGVDISGLSAPIVASSGSGSITLTGTGSARATAGSGNVEVIQIPPVTSKLVRDQDPSE